MLNNSFFSWGLFFLRNFLKKDFFFFLYNFQNELYKFTFFKKERKKLFFFLVAISSFFFFTMPNAYFFFLGRSFFFSSHFWIFSDAQFLVCSFFEHKFIGVQRRLQPPPSLHHRPWRYCHLWPQQLAHRRADRLRLRGRACCASARNQWPLGKWALSTALRCARARLHCGPRLQEGAEK